MPEVPSSEAIHWDDPLWRTYHSCHYPCLGCSSGGLGRRPWSCLLSSPCPYPCLCLWDLSASSTAGRAPVRRPPWSRKLVFLDGLHCRLQSGAICHELVDLPPGISLRPQECELRTRWRAHRTNHTIHPSLTW